MTEDILPDGGDDNVGPEQTHFSYEISNGELPSEAVVRAVSIVTNTPILELDLLYDVINPVHLDEFFGWTSDRTVRTKSTLSFTYVGCEVTVTHTEVDIRETGEDFPS